MFCYSLGKCEYQDRRLQHHSASTSLLPRDGREEIYKKKNLYSGVHEIRKNHCEKMVFAFLRNALKRTLQLHIFNVE